MSMLPGQFVSYADDQTAIFSDGYVKKMAEWASSIDAELKSKRSEMVVQMLQQQSETISKRMVAALEKFMDTWSKAEQASEGNS
jgi:hypothetical protein